MPSSGPPHDFSPRRSDDWRERVLLAALSKEGLFAVAVVTIALYLTYNQTKAGSSAQLEAIAEQLAVHNRAMEAAEAARQADEANRLVNDRVTRTLLRGICIGTSGDIPQARALCEMQTEGR